MLTLATSISFLFYRYSLSVCSINLEFKALLHSLNFIPASTLIYYYATYNNYFSTYDFHSS